MSDLVESLAAGFARISSVDLSPYLELRRPRDRAVRVLLGLASMLPARWARLEQLQGGDALQECLERGWIGYDFVVFERSGSA